MKRRRGRFLYRARTAIALCAISWTVNAQTYPAHLVRVIGPQAAGSWTDMRRFHPTGNHRLAAVGHRLHAANR
jgi:hypothetical protein